MPGEIVTETVPRRRHYWWCPTCDTYGPKEDRLDFAFNALRVHRKVNHYV